MNVTTRRVSRRRWRIWIPLLAYLALSEVFVIRSLTGYSSKTDRQNASLSDERFECDIFITP